MPHYLMYVDESGVASLTDHQSEYFLLTGIVVEHTVDEEISAYFNHIKRRHGFELGNSLHSYDLFEKKGGGKYLDDNKCRAFTESIGEFVENSPFEVLIYYVDKNELRKKLGIPSKRYQFKGSSRKHKEDKEVAYEILARKMFLDFAKILKKNRAIGSVVAESRGQADKVLLTAYVSSREPNVFAKKPKSAKTAQIAREKMHSICFADKGSLKGGLELADIVSFCALAETSGKFSTKRGDRRGIKSMWQKIKKRLKGPSIVKLSTAEMYNVAPDRIDEISELIAHRMKEANDLF